MGQRLAAEATNSLAEFLPRRAHLVPNMCANRPHATASSQSNLMKRRLILSPFWLFLSLPAYVPGELAKQLAEAISYVADWPLKRPKFGRAEERAVSDDLRPQLRTERHIACLLRIFGHFCIRPKNHVRLRNEFFKGIGRLSPVSSLFPCRQSRSGKSRDQAGTYVNLITPSPRRSLATRRSGGRGPAKNGVPRPSTMGRR
jgi:hypothetical protein